MPLLRLRRGQPHDYRCLDCGQPVAFDQSRKVWRHHQRQLTGPRTFVRNGVSVARATSYHSVVGISDTSTDTMCGARKTADPSRAGVSRLEGSAP